MELDVEFRLDTPKPQSSKFHFGSNVSQFVKMIGSDHVPSSRIIVPPMFCAYTISSDASRAICTARASDAPSPFEIQIFGPGQTSASSYGCV